MADYIELEEIVVEDNRVFPTHKEQDSEVGGRELPVCKEGKTRAAYMNVHAVLVYMLHLWDRFYLPLIMWPLVFFKNASF